MQPRLKTLLNLLGALFAVSGAIIVVQKIAVYFVDININGIENSVWGLLVLFIFFHAAANLLLAFGWGNVLQHHKLKVPTLWLVKVFFTSQIGKYIPGNIFHLAGRQLMSTAAGYSKTVIAKSLLWELILLSVVGGLISLLAIPFIVGFKAPLLLGLLIFTIAFALVFVFTIRLFSKDICIAGLLYGLFLIISSVFFSLIYQALSDESLPMNIQVIVLASFTLSWLSGFLTPGSPAGLGVRELVLLLLLGPWMNEAHLVFSVVLSRTISASGDLLSSLAGLAITHAGEPKKNDHLET